MGHLRDGDRSTMNESVPELTCAVACQNLDVLFRSSEERLNIHRQLPHRRVDCAAVRLDYRPENVLASAHQAKAALIMLANFHQGVESFRSMDQVDHPAPSALGISKALG